MGSTGFTLTGVDPGGDCVMLWTDALTVSSLQRALLANVGVLLLAVLAQYLTTTSANKMQRAKAYAKQARAAMAMSTLGASIALGLSRGNGNYSSTAAYPSEQNGAIEDAFVPATVSTFATTRNTRLTGSTSTLLAHPELPKVSNWEHCGDSLQHGLRILIAYLLMLVAMTYDIALIGSIVAGFMIGYFLFTKDTTKVPASADPCCS